jgi:DNA-binding transcriptional ArsR family regulator
VVYGLLGDALDEAALDAVFGALAHRSRRAVVQYLVHRETPTAMNDLAANVGMSPQLLNKHAAALERPALISRTAHGREKHVSAHPEVLAAAQQWIDEVTAYWNAQLDSLDEYVTSLRDTGHTSRERD